MASGKQPTNEMILGMARQLASAAVAATKWNAELVRFQHVDLIDDGEIVEGGVKFRVGLNLEPFDPMSARLDWDAEIDITVDARGVWLDNSKLPNSVWFNQRDGKWAR